MPVEKDYAWTSSLYRLTERSTISIFWASHLCALNKFAQFCLHPPRRAVATKVLKWSSMENCIFYLLKACFFTCQSSGAACSFSGVQGGVANNPLLPWQHSTTYAPNRAWLPFFSQLYRLLMVSASLRNVFSFESRLFLQHLNHQIKVWSVSSPKSKTHFWV